MNISYMTPDKDALTPMVSSLKSTLLEQGIDLPDMVNTVIQNMMTNAKRHKAQGIDAWLWYGVYLPAVERVISASKGESREDFLTRTEYPANVVDAYTVEGEDLTTLVAADSFWWGHRNDVPCNTTVWPLNTDDDPLNIDLSLFEGRIQ